MNSTSRRLITTILAVASLLAPAVPAGADHHVDQRADAVAERALEAMGGADAWQATRFIRFNFAGRRLHHWDKQTGRHRVEFTDREGDAWIVLHNVVSRQGRAFKNGQELVGQARADALEQAHGAWINDTYWLLMPYKLRDPGVTLTHAGEETIDGRVHDRLMLTFDGVGLTPGDRYWASIDRESGLMTRWAYHLQGWEEDRPATAWNWRGWQRYGRIMLAPERVETESGRELPMADIAVFDQLPDELFTDPESPPESR